MSDKITACNKIKVGGEISQWDFSFDVEHGQKKNQFCVVILASEMTDPTDKAEAKTKAKVKAKAIKEAWKAEPNSDVNDVPSEIGDVDLS